MKPDWDTLMEEFKDSKTSGVYDVDCTSDSGKDLCEKQGVSGYPTIKYGDPDSLQAYEGGRTLDDLKKFAAENLGPTCGPTSLDGCDEADKALVESFMAMSKADLAAKIKDLDKGFNKREKDFKKKMDKFMAKDEEFRESVAEAQGQLAKLDKEQVALDKRSATAKLSKNEVAAATKKQKKLREKAEKVVAQTEKHDNEMKAIEAVKTKIDEDSKAAGLKLMKVVLKSKPKDEL